MALQVKDGNGALVNTPAFDRAFSASLLAFAPAITTSATDCQLITLIGVAGVVARLKRIRVLPRLTTLAAEDLRLERWSTLGTIGSAVATAIPTVARHGSPNAPGSVPAAPGIAVSSIGTAAYTTSGTVTGIFAQRRVNAKSTTIVDAAPDVFELHFATHLDQAPEICGALDVIALVVKPLATATGSVFDIEVQWEEAVL